jgi:hypothetical protein
VILTDCDVKHTPSRKPFMKKALLTGIIGQDGPNGRFPKIADDSHLESRARGGRKPAVLHPRHEKAKTNLTPGPMAAHLY